MACLDTSLLVDAAGRSGRALKVRVAEKLNSLVAAGEILTTTRFNVAEMWIGVERARDRDAEVHAVLTILEPLAILEFDDLAARDFGRITAHLYALGAPRGDMDVLIASVALVHGQRMVTRNTRHFEGIPELTVESY